MHIDLLSSPVLKTKIGMVAAKNLMSTCTQRQLGFANMNNQIWVRSGTGTSVRATVINHPGHRVTVQYKNGATECIPAKYNFISSRVFERVEQCTKTSKVPLVPEYKFEIRNFECQVGIVSSIVSFEFKIILKNN